MAASAKARPQFDNVDRISPATLLDGSLGPDCRIDRARFWTAGRSSNAAGTSAGERRLS